MSHRNSGFRAARIRLLTASSVLAFSCACLISAQAHATVSIAPTVTNWTGNGTDPTLFSDPNNWSNGVPTTSLPASFNFGGTANIAVSAGQQVGSVTVDGGSTVNLLPGSTLNDDMIVGDAGTGTFNNTNATHNVTGNLIVGNQSSGNGAYTVTGNSASTTVGFAGAAGSTPSETPNGALIVGNNGTGSFVQGTDVTDAGNQVAVAGDLAVGLQSGSTGTYTINSGTLTVGGLLVVGENSTNNNVFTQNGGAVNITGTASSDSRYAPVTSPAFGSSFGDLYLGAASTSDNGAGTYNLNGGSLTAANVFLGFGGTGTLNQSGGTVVTSLVDLGDCGGCNGGNSAGFYNLTGTGSLTANALNVGDYGHGEFLQNGVGTVNAVSGTLSIGNGAYPTPDVANPGNYDRSGLYTLDAGNLSTQYTIVGALGKGTFIQSGGTHAVANTLTIGQTNQPLSTSGSPIFGGPAPGLYTMTGGTLTAGGDSTGNADTGNSGIIVGDAGNGTFNQTGGTVTSGVSGGQRGDLLIGAQAGSTGSYSLTDPANTGNVSLTVNGNTDIGRDAAFSGMAAAVGSLTIGNGTDNPTFQTNATSTTNGDVTVGDAGNGTLTVNSGTVGINGNLNVGVNGTGTVTQSGGSVSASYVDLSTAVGGGSSSYTITGGSLSTVNDLNVGGGSSGTQSFTQSGSTTQTNVGGTLRVGNANNTASLSLSNGTLNVTGDAYVGAGALSGTLTQIGGSHLVGGTLYVGDGTSNGLYTLTGGTLSTGITGGSSIGDVVVGNGGTGEIDNSGGQQLSNTATIGWSGSGTYKLTGTGSLNVSSNEYIGATGTGTFVQGDGNGTTTNTVGGDLYMGETFGGASSSYTLTDGLLQTTGSEFIGLASNSTFTQSGGTHTVGGNLDLGELYSTATQYGNGSYALSGNGSLSVTGSTQLGVNTGTAGTFTQSGGSFTTQTLAVGVNGTGTFTQTGGTTNVLGAMTVGNAGTATVTSLQANSIVNNNKLILANASVTAPITNYGLLEGTGTITGNVTNNGIVHPGASPGILNVTGNYTQSSTGAMDFTLNGTTPGTGYSQMNVTGSVSLAGALDLTDTSFKLSSAETFALINSGLPVSGNFSSLSYDNSACTQSSGTYACSGNGQIVDFKEIVSGKAVNLQVASVSAVPLPGSLPLFGTAIVGLMGFAASRRRSRDAE